MRLFLSPVIRWLAALPWSDFLRIVGAAAWAGESWAKTPGMSEEDRQAANASRASYVRKWIAERLPFLTGWKLNVIMELAVAYLNRTAK